MSQIDARSTVQISLLGGLLSIAIYGTFNTTRWMTRMEATMDDLQREVPKMKDQLSSIENTISNRLDDRWTESDMRWYVDKLKEQNPTLSIPDILRRP
jgi:hypothetical protein